VSEIGSSIAMILLLGTILCIENITLCIYGCSAEFSEVLMVPASTATSFHDSGILAALAS